MDGATLTNLIGSLGFPIAAACFMAWYQVNTMKEFRTSLDANTKCINELILMIREGRKNDRKTDMGQAGISDRQ